MEFTGLPAELPYIYVYCFDDDGGPGSDDLIGIVRVPLDGQTGDTWTMERQWLTITGSQSIGLDELNPFKRSNTTVEEDEAAWQQEEESNLAFRVEDERALDAHRM